VIRPGTYILLIKLDRDRDIIVGALGKVSFQKGTYCYVGSAMSGLDQRIGRHLSKEKRMRWHIDYLTSVADGVEAYESYPDPIPECSLARIAEESGGTPVVNGFGCSDCHCATHLFRLDGQSEKCIRSSKGLVVHNIADGNRA
jgi:Uri superfamily endonuclease